MSCRYVAGVDWGRPSQSCVVVARVDKHGKLEILMAHSYEERQEIEEQLDDCLAVKSMTTDQGGPGYSKRDQDFLDSISEQWQEKGWLSEKQLSWLNDLHERI